MDVRCPQCDTLYEIDARQLRGGAATLKCSQCDHVFRLQTHAALSQENQRRWMVKNSTSGDVLYFSSFDQLHQWILQGKVQKTDQVSRTGKKWKRLADIGEFRPIFQAVDSISSISASHGAEKNAPNKPGQPDQPGQPSKAGDSKPGPGDSRPKKVKTSPQFGAQQPGSARASGPLQAVSSPPAGGSNESRNEASRPGPAHTSAPTPSSQTPAPHSPTPHPPRPQTPRGQTPRGQTPRGQTAAPADGANRSGSGPKVRLQTGAFGAPSAQQDDDEWSFGDGSTLGEVEGTGRHEAVEVSNSSKSRWPVVLMVMLLVVGAGGAAVYFVRPDLIDKVLPAAVDDEVVAIAGDDEKAGASEKAGGEEKPPRERVGLAVTAAFDAASTANATELSAGIEAAAPKVAAGVEEAQKAATKAGEEPDPDELLASAKRYLERGNPDRARRKFHQVLEADRGNVEAITGLGWSLLALGNPGAASAQFQKALNFNAGYGDAYIGLGKAEREQGNHQAALRAYENYLSRFPAGRKASIAEYQAGKLKETLGQ